MRVRHMMEIALRILSAWNEGRLPDAVDVAVLRDAFPSSAGLPDDELACQVIHDLACSQNREPGEGKNRFMDHVA